MRVAFLHSSLVRKLVLALNLIFAGCGGTPLETARGRLREAAATRDHDKIIRACEIYFDEAGGALAEFEEAPDVISMYEQSLAKWLVSQTTDLDETAHERIRRYQTLSSRFKDLVTAKAGGEK